MRIKVVFALVLVVTIGLLLPSLAQQTVTVEPYMAVLKTDPKTIAPGKAATLDIFVMDASSMEPSPGLSVTASLSMSAMSGMTLETPKVTPGDKPGHYNVRVTFPHSEEYKLDLNVKTPVSKSVLLSFKITPGSVGEGAMKGMEGMEGMAGMQRKATLAVCRREL